MIMKNFKYELESAIASIGPGTTNRAGAADVIQHHSAAVELRTAENKKELRCCCVEH